MRMFFLILCFSVQSFGQLVQDYDANAYSTVVIGNQVWLKENLKSTHYSDGTPIPDAVAYNNSDDLGQFYGLLYTWDAAMKGSTVPKTQGACPCGWHVPSHEEWAALETALGGSAVAGGKMKEAGTEHWNSPNTGGSNSSGFTALPGGEYDAYSSPNRFQLFREFAVFWTSTQINASKARERYLSYNSPASSLYDWYKVMKYSIRCIGDSTKAKLSGAPTYGYRPLEVHFTDESTPQGIMKSWSWDFDNDGTIDSHEQNPTWMYPDTGTYSVKLIVSDSLTSDTLLQENYIHVMAHANVNIDITYRTGWNLVSVPVEPEVSISLPSMFTYSGRYIQIDSMLQGRGYWAKPDERHRYAGYPLLAETIEVSERWNIIGSITEPVPVSRISSIPPGIATSNFFQYEGKGVYSLADTIKPGSGYWVKVNQDGQLILSVSSIMTAKNQIRIIPTSELPPAAPSGESFASELPKQYVLQQNYPNPFNPSTIIKYDLPNGGYVMLSVYNMLGQEIAVLVDGYQEAGYKSIKFDMNNIPSGVYVYRLTARQEAGGQAGTYTDIKKMILIR